MRDLTPCALWLHAGRDEQGQDQQRNLLLARCAQTPSLLLVAAERAARSSCLLDLEPCLLVSFRTADETQIISRIEDRISRWTMTAKQQGEGLQVLKYAVSTSPQINRSKRVWGEWEKRMCGGRGRGRASEWREREGQISVLTLVTPPLPSISG